MKNNSQPLLDVNKETIIGAAREGPGINFDPSLILFNVEKIRKSSIYKDLIRGCLEGASGGEEGSREDIGTMLGMWNIHFPELIYQVEKAWNENAFLGWE